jgi:hypothetical protein
MSLPPWKPSSKQDASIVFLHDEPKNEQMMQRMHKGIVCAASFHSVSSVENEFDFLKRLTTENIPRREEHGPAVMLRHRVWRPEQQRPAPKWIVAPCTVRPKRRFEFQARAPARLFSAWVD